MERDFEINGKKFRLSSLDVFKKFHVFRHVGPILADLVPAVVHFKKLSGKELSEVENLESMAKIATPVMVGLSKLSKPDSEFVLHGLLEAVEINQASGNWAKVSSGDILMIQNLPLPMILNIAARSFAFNYSDFLDALPS